MVIKKRIKRKSISKIENIRDSKGIAGFVFAVVGLGIFLASPLLSLGFSITAIVLSVLQQKERKILLSKISITLSIISIALALIVFFLYFLRALMLISNLFLI